MARWLGLFTALGIILLSVGASGFAVGLGIAYLGPAWIDDSAEGAGYGGDASSGGGFLGIGESSNRDPSGEERRAAVAQARAETRILGAMVAASGLAVAVTGGIVSAVARGVLASRTGARPPA